MYTYTCVHTCTQGCGTTLNCVALHTIKVTVVTSFRSQLRKQLTSFHYQYGIATILYIIKDCISIRYIVGLLHLLVFYSNQRNTATAVFSRDYGWYSILKITIECDRLVDLTNGQNYGIYRNYRELATFMLLSPFSFILANSKGFMHKMQK